MISDFGSGMIDDWQGKTVLSPGGLGVRTQERVLDCRALPVGEIVRAFHSLPQAHWARVGLGMLFLTGCRLSELGKMMTRDVRLNEVEGYFVKFWLGKNQRSYRKEVLPGWFVGELEQYRRENRVPFDRLFAFDGNTFRTRFNKFVRPLLGGVWLQKSVRDVSPVRQARLLAEEYDLQVRGVRHTHSTLFFYKVWKEKGSLSWALEETSKKMHHKTARMTAFHYIQNFDRVEAEKYFMLSYGDILRQDGQTTL